MSLKWEIAFGAIFQLYDVWITRDKIGCNSVCSMNWSFLSVEGAGEKCYCAMGKKISTIPYFEKIKEYRVIDVCTGK